MTLNTTYSPTVADGNGVTKSFSYSFNPISENYLKVSLEQNGSWVEQVSGWNATVSENGGVVTFDTAPTTRVAIERDVPEEQPTSYKTSSGFQAQVIEHSFDMLTGMAQELKEKSDRSIAVDVGSSVNPQEVVAQVERVYDSIDNIDSVADDLTNIDAVNANKDNIDTVAGDKANIDAVAPNISKVNSVANNMSAVKTVANDMAAVRTVDGIRNQVITVAINSAAITAVNNNKTNIDIVANNKSDVNTVANNISSVVNVGNNVNHISRVDANKDNIDAVADDITNVNRVGGSINNVNSVAAGLGDISDVLDNMTNIDTVAGSITNVRRVGNNISKVVEVADDLTNIDAVASNKTNIDIVASNNANVARVGSNINNVNEVGSNIANVNTVAGDHSNISTVVNNLTAINAAPTYAAQAQQWAIGVPGEPSGGSAKYWAERAEDAASGLENPANRDLSNLTADGQAVIETADATISNYIKDVPQNIKCSIASNVVTLTTGSILTNTGATYATTTTTANQTYTIDSSLADGNYLLCSNGAAIQAPLALSVTGSGASLPADGSTYTYFFNTTDKLIYKYTENAWSATSYCYPFALVTMSSGVATFAKDSNGNDMIFNGMGFVGHHIFTYPNISAYIPAGFNTDGSLASTKVNTNALRIIEALSGYGYDSLKRWISLQSNHTVSNWSGYIEVNHDSEADYSIANIRYYARDINLIKRYNSGSVSAVDGVPLVEYFYDGSNITSFTPKQCARLVTVDMLPDSYTKEQVDTKLASKQDTLVSGTNIKTINNMTVLGSGNFALADQSLSNLNSNGQMIVDSQNGTISNCILEIPQNLKLEFNNGTVTLKAGSIITRTGSTYATLTTTQDITWSSSTQENKKMYLFATNSGNTYGLYNSCTLEQVGSGDTLPANGSTYSLFFNTTDKLIYSWSNKTWSTTNIAYPLAIVETDENATIKGFAKDSNGNDMIFNGAGFVGHHAFVYPNVKVLIPYGFNADGSLKSISVARSALTIKEILGNQYFSIGSATAINPRPSYFEVNTLDDLYAKNIQGFYYVKSINQCYSWGGGSGVLYAGNYVFIHVNISGEIVTDFTIRQPVRLATTEMLNNGGSYISTVTANSNISRKIKDRFADVINVKDFGAVGDGVTDDSPAFALVEALSNQDVYVPDGAYKINRYTPANITKNYFGPGELLFGNSREKPLVKQVNPITDASAPIKSINRSVVFIGDSITSGFGNPAGPTVSYVDMLQQKIATVSNVPTCNRASFCNLDYEAKTGTWTRGTAGPIERSIILSAGATISFTANYVDLIQVFYQRSNTTTDLTIACNKPAFSETLTTTTGTSIARLEPSEYIKSKEQATITITNSGSNDIELTGIGLYTEAYTGTVYFHNFSCPGYTTANFAKESVINAIVGQTFNNGNAPIFLIELGTNDCYGGLVSPSDFKSNMEYIVSGLLTKAPTAGIVLCQPWLKDGYGATLGTPVQYRDALNAVAVKYGCTVFDGAELDLNRYNSILRADNLHPSPDGYKLLTSWFWEKLKLNSWTQPEIITGITVETGFSSGGDARVKIKNKRAYLNGHIDLGSSINIATDTAIFSVPKKFAPKNKKYFSTSSNSSIGVVNLYMDTDGIMKISGKSETNIRFIFIEGISWSMEH